MKIIQIISEHKSKLKGQQGNKFKRHINPLKSGYKRIEAIVLENGFKTTRHIDIL